jgi:glycosyltransferase involved in cell wall biosynthesis
LIFVSKLINKKNVFRIPSEVDIIAKNYVIKTIFNYSVSNWLPLTNEQLQYLVNTGVNRSKIIEPPNTIVSNEFFTKRKPKSKSIKTELIYCGRLINQKGLNIFIEALNNLNKDMLIEVTFLLSMSVESPEQARTNLKLLNTLQYPFKIKFESTETATNFAQCDIGIFSSLKEGAPNVVREMMASGLAVVASDIPGCSEIINNNQNGLLFRVGSISELANKLRYLLKSRLLIKKLGTNARNTILESCSEDKIMTKILK